MKHLGFGLLAVCASPVLAHDGVHLHPHDSALTPWLMGIGAVSILAGMLIAARRRA
ncbi:hypothetical protein [Sagittula stellata]|uniref:Peptidase M23 n=1 Tax=Sagittula stellata (strain ATCC 700073 / DSM 11524 / E-37) TaxID=388399 RepID=A3K0T5_SAGS3|nr:hypothetical protein [Sagittula stellata]EBA09400.1 hypothetical protein SSE37_24199 [Sagittula stellata E-37]